MPENVGDLLERGTRPDHSGGRSVAKRVCPLGRDLNPEPLERPSDDGPDRARIDATSHRKKMADEHVTLTALGPPMTEVLSDCTSHRDW